MDTTSLKARLRDLDLIPRTPYRPAARRTKRPDRSARSITPLAEQNHLALRAATTEGVQIPEYQAIASVSPDGAYDTKACNDDIAARDACVVIPARRNAQGWPESTPGVAARNEIVRSSCRLGRAIWKRWSGYHQRSMIETKMHCFKLLGNASWYETSIAKSPNCKSRQPSSTASPHSEDLKLSVSLNRLPPTVDC